LVEIGASYQIRWNILREHNWGVPSAHIKFIYYVTCVIHYLIVLCISKIQKNLSGLRLLIAQTSTLSCSSFLLSDAWHKHEQKS